MPNVNVEVDVVAYLSPVYPDVPAVPEVPAVPLLPVVPLLPELPLVPLVPLVPEEPEVPIVPEVSAATIPLTATKIPLSFLIWTSPVKIPCSAIVIFLFYQNSNKFICQERIIYC